MVKELLTKVYFIICCTLLMCSCVEDIDFDQARDLEITPVLESSLIFFDEPSDRFFDNEGDIISIQDSVVIDLFNGAFIVDNLIKAEFKFETINSINSAFELQVDLFDANELQHTFTILQEASPNNNEISSNHIETFEDNTLEALKKSTLLVFTLRMLPDATINQNTLGKIRLKSLVAFYFKIEDSS